MLPRTGDRNTVTENKIGKRRQQIFFPNLDGLRFVCFFLVFLFHAYKTLFQNLQGGTARDRQLFWLIEFLFQNGELGVNFFFVLSGFLITYLLVQEKRATGSIHLRHFYLRRVLRIWPLFYLCVFIGFGLMPLLKSVAGQPAEEIARLPYYLLFLNNFDYIQSWPSFPDALILIVLWSVAVEEQFYLAWPLLLKWIPIRLYPLVFSLVIGLSLLFRAFYTDTTDGDEAVRQFHTVSVIGDMAWGGLMAYYCSYRSRFLRTLTQLKKWQIGGIYLLALAFLLFRKDLFATPIALVFERLCMAAVFGLIILEQNFSNHSLFKFSRFKRMSQLGIYTYGLYCLHFFLISMVQASFWKIGLELTGAISAFIAFLLALLLTGVVCFFSYRYFERPFLRLKDRFSLFSRP